MQYRTLRPLLALFALPLAFVALTLSAQTDDANTTVDLNATVLPEATVDLNSPADTTPLSQPASPVAGEVEIPDLPDFDMDMQMPEDDEVLLDLPGTGTDGSAPSREGETISVDFPDEEVRTIIRNVAELYDLNVVIPEALVGTVSIKLRNVTWRQVFEVVLEPLGYTYVEDRNIIKIRSQDELLTEPVDTRVFVINFARAAEIQPAILPLIDSANGGRVQVETRTNSLVITERPSRMNKVQEIIEVLDTPTEQVMIESKFVEVTNRDIKDLGVNWNSLQGYSIGIRGTDENNGNITREWSRSRGVNGNSGIATSDQTSNTTNTSSGTLNGNLSTTVAGSGTFTETLSGNLAYIAQEGRLDNAIFSADSFSLVLSALETKNDIEVVSNPTVVTLNNSAAQINIGEEFPIPQYTYNDQRGTFEVSGFEYKPIGIILNVTPQINSAGFINLSIAPEISSRTGTVSFGGAAGAEIPIITTRKTESQVTIKSGFTLAIGGLIEKTYSEGDTAVPLVSRIPVLGRLFKSESDTLDKRNLIIFITAKILSAEGSTYREVFSQRTLYEMGIKTRDLPGYEPPTSEEALFDQIQTARDEIEQLEAEAQLRAQLEALRGTKDKQEERDQREAEGEDREIPRRNKP